MCKVIDHSTTLLTITMENGLPLEITSREQYLKFIDEYAQNRYRFQ